MRIGGEGQDRVPQLAPGCDLTAQALTPEEGFLLSRIDGHTPLSLLREIAGLPAAAVDRIVEKLVKDGLLVFDAPEQPCSAAIAPVIGDGPSAEVLIDPSLDIDVEFQRQILEFETRLDQPYHELLGVAVDADTRAIKKAYFGLSKLYHPDRYFRRQLGPFERKLDGVFKKILEAYELLSDPATRAEVQRDLATDQAASQAEAPSASEEAKPASPPPSAKSARRLRARLKRLSGHRRVLDERRRKAKTFFESGMAAFRAERWLEAAGSVRLAIAFDPGNAEFTGAFGDVQRRAHEERAAQLTREATAASDLGDWKEAQRLYEEAVHYRPFDAQLAFKAGRLAWKLDDDIRKAKELLASACELEPDNAGYRLTLGQVYKDAGFAANARRELEAVLRLEPKNKEAKAELKSL